MFNMLLVLSITYLVGFILTLIYWVFLKNGNKGLSLKSISTFILLWIVSPITILVLIIGVIVISIRMIIETYTDSKYKL